MLELKKLFDSVSPLVHKLPFAAGNRYNRAPFAPVRRLIWTKIRDLHR